MAIALRASHKLVMVATALALAAVVAAPAPARAAATPTDVVETFHERLLTVWRDADDTTTRQRFETLEEPVRTAFDLEEMIRIATGSAWASATPAEREALIDAFTRYSAAGWASRFDSYKGQTFRTVGTRPGPGERVIVETHIVPTEGKPVSLDYVVDTASGPPQIVDIIAKGVSELARLRSDYRSTLRSEGPGRLATRIEELADSRLNE